MLASQASTLDELLRLPADLPRAIGGEIASLMGLPDDIAHEIGPISWRGLPNHFCRRLTLPQPAAIGPQPDVAHRPPKRSSPGPRLCACAVRRLRPRLPDRVFLEGRGVCSSCNTRRMVATAAHLTDHVLPSLPVRQWVWRCQDGCATSWSTTPTFRARRCGCCCARWRKACVRAAQSAAIDRSAGSTRRGPRRSSSMPAGIGIIPNASRYGPSANRATPG